MAEHGPGESRFFQSMRNSQEGVADVAGDIVGGGLLMFGFLNLLIPAPNYQYRKHSGGGHGHH